MLTNFFPYLTMVKNPKIESSDLEFNRVRAAVKEHVGAKFHRTKCRG